MIRDHDRLDRDPEPKEARRPGPESRAHTVDSTDPRRASPARHDVQRLRSGRLGAGVIGELQKLAGNQAVRSLVPASDRSVTAIQRDPPSAQRDGDTATRVDSANSNLDAARNDLVLVDAALTAARNGVAALDESQTAFEAQGTVFNQALLVHKSEIAGIKRDLELPIEMLKMIVDGLMAATPLATAKDEIMKALVGLADAPDAATVFGRKVKVSVSPAAKPVSEKAKPSGGGPRGGVPGAAEPSSWLPETAFYKQVASVALDGARLLELVTPVGDAKAALAVGKERVEQLRANKSVAQSPEDLENDSLALKLLTSRLAARTEAIEGVGKAGAGVRDSVLAVSPTQEEAERSIWVMWVSSIPHTLLDPSVLANPKLQRLLKKKGVWDMLGVTELPGYSSPHAQQLIIFMAEAITKASGSRGQMIDGVEADGTMVKSLIPIAPDLPPLRAELTDPRFDWQGPAVIVGGFGMRQPDFTYEGINDKKQLFAVLYGKGYVGLRLRPVTSDRAPDDLDKAMKEPGGG